MSLLEKKDEIEEEVIKRLKSVYDPEIPVNIYDLGLIYKIDFEEKNNYLFATIEMTLTSPACPVAESLVEQVKYVTQTVDEIDEAYVHLVFNPPWEPSMISEDGKDIMAASGAHI
ncbi:FeS assembly SUF system protein [Halarcobacter mediterraneus]|uniref:FeS assembly SUF system protein n=1 Tax=Halarcobacter mediterraneus TaxID=2023153 RepID=A0A4Q1AT62_9BACT|nr:iron-sulfur cluster assembly protein [Halarcobacter mediterraneus]RXK11638.1 FeS assembly SUF system protein [Halarcobacter mediterraneus]